MWLWLVMASAASAQTELLPGVEISLTVDPGDSLYFMIHHSSLTRDSQYEVRLSYLGTVGADLSLSWEPCALDYRSGIKMLDTDKLVFGTDESRNIGGQFCEQYLFRLKCTRISRSAQPAPPPVSFFIVLERYTGPVPDSTLPLLALLFGFIPTALLLSFFIFKRP